MKKTFAITTLVFCLFFTGAKPTHAEETIIKDPALSAIIKKQLSIEHEPTEQDLESILYVTIPKNSGVKSLEGLEYAKNTKNLWITESEDIKDFSALEKLHKLEELQIRSMSLNDDNVPVLDSHPILRSLGYQDSMITEKSFEKIIKTPSIMSLQLNSNAYIASFGVLPQMSNLEYIMMQFTGVSDFRAVNDFAKLKSLSAYGQATIEAPIELNLSDLIWNEADETLTIKRDSIERILINHNGKTYEPSATYRYISINGSYLRADENETDFIVSGVTPQNFSEIESLKITTRFDVGADETVGPAGFTNYVMSNIGYSKNISIVKDEIDFEVEYVDNEGEEIKTSTQVNGTLMQEYSVTAPVIPGYTFADSSEPLKGRLRTNQFSTMKLRYEPDAPAKYSVTFDSNEGTPVLPMNDIISGSKINAPAEPTRSGYTFAGWTKDGVAWDFDTMVVTDNITLVAQWDLIVVPAVKHTVTFDSNGGSAVLPISNIISGTSITAPSEPTRSGYTFVGWTKDGITWDFDTMVVTDNITLVAQWDLIVVPAVKHTVTFDSNGGSAVLPISNIISGTSIAAPSEPTRSGYTFAGWTKDGVAWDFDTMVVTEDITLVAQWSKDSVNNPEIVPPVIEEETNKPNIEVQEGIKPNDDIQENAKPGKDVLPSTGIAGTLNFGYSLVLAGFFTLLFKKKSE